MRYINSTCMIKSIKIEKTKTATEMFTVPFDLKRPLLKVFRSEFNTKALFKWSLKGDDNYNYHVLSPTSSVYHQMSCNLDMLKFNTIVN